MHKPAQVELQLDRPQLPYSETLGPIVAGGSPAHCRRRQPNPTRKGPHTCQFFVALIIGLFCLLGFYKWPSTFSPLNIWNVSAIHMWMKGPFCPFLIFSLLLPFHGFFFLFKLWTPFYSYIYPFSYCEQGCLFEFPSLAVIFKTEPPLH